MTMDPTAIRNAVSAYYAAVRGGDVDVIAPMFAVDAVMRDPVGQPPATDDVSRRQRYAGISAIFESFAINEELIIAAGDEAAARWTARGKTRAGKDLRFDGISTFTFDAAGRIAEMSAYFDIAAVMAQMQG
jgi:ketosteroid isomerase-like protein